MKLSLSLRHVRTLERLYVFNIRIKCLGKFHVHIFFEQRPYVGLNEHFNVNSQSFHNIVSVGMSINGAAGLLLPIKAVDYTPAKIGHVNWTYARFSDDYDDPECYETEELPHSYVIYSHPRTPVNRIDVCHPAC